MGSSRLSAALKESVGNGRRAGNRCCYAAGPQRHIGRPTRPARGMGQDKTK